MGQPREWKNPGAMWGWETLTLAASCTSRSRGQHAEGSGGAERGHDCKAGQGQMGGAGHTRAPECGPAQGATGTPQPGSALASGSEPFPLRWAQVCRSLLASDTTGAQEV